MTVSHLSQLRLLQEENAKLKRMYADLALMYHALKDVVARASGFPVASTPERVR